MLELQRVIAVIDPNNESQPVLDKVLTLAKLQQFELELISCDYTQYLVEGYYFDAVDVPRLREEYLEERKLALEALAGPLRDQGLNVETRAIWAHPAFEAVIHEVQRTSADLLVMHTRRHGAVSRLFLTNDDWQLVRCCPCPLLLVKEQSWKHEPVILAAVDPLHARHKPSGLDHKVIRSAEDIARAMNGEVHVLHSFNQTPLSGTYLEQAQQQHQQAFQELMNDFEVSEDRQYLVEEAPEFALSQQEAKLNCDLVVMGAISRSILSDVFVGNTTEKVLDYLNSDVLVVKPDDFESPVKPRE